MNKFLLILFLYGAAISSKADRDILSQDFSSGFEKVDTLYEKTNIDGWTVYKCKFLNTSIYPSSLWLGNEDGSYLISPEFGSLATSNVLLTFLYTNTASNKNSTFSVIINNGGHFEDGTSNKSITIPMDYYTNFKSDTLKIFGVTSSTTLTFQLVSASEKKYCAIDDIKVTAENIQIDETTDNSSVITAKTTDVSLGRTLTEGIWNTLCLPFDVDKSILARALGENQDIQLRTYSNCVDGVMIFESVEYVDAGTPFLIKLNKTVNNPIFECVDVKDTEAQVVKMGGVGFAGVYSPYDLPADDEENVYMFLSTTGKLMKPSGDSRTLKGLRAYFIAPAAVAARLILGDAGVTLVDNAIRSTMDDVNVWYAVSGIRYNQQPTKKGLYIKNGKKIIIK